MTEDCKICLSGVSEIERYDICPCKSNVHQECFKHYLLTSPVDANCPKCKIPVSEVKLNGFLGRDWIIQVYNPYRTELYFQLQETLMPNDQEEAANVKRSNQLDKLRKFYYQKSIYLNKFLKETSPHDKITRTKLRKEIEHFTLKLIHIRAEISELYFNRCTISERRGVICRNTNITKCEYKDCKGFITKDNSCGLCGIKYCSECGEIENLETHVCNEDKILSLKLIMKETKPCPKCGIRITRISGCDDMFCTSCKTCFNWITLTVQTMNSNPHFSEWNKNQEVPENQHLQDFIRLSSDRRITRGLNFSFLLDSFERLLRHETTSTYDRDYIATSLRTNRIKYLSGEKTEDWFKRSTFKLTMMSKYLDLRRNLFLSFLRFIVEELREIRPGETEGCEFSKTIEEKYIAKFNACFEDITKAFGYRRRYIDITERNIYVKIETEKQNPNPRIRR